MHMLLKAVLTLTLLIASNHAYAAHQLASDIAGQVVDQYKQPIAGATVTVTHVETGRVVKRTTNSRGRYIAPNVRPDGTYIVAVTAEQGSVVFKAAAVDLGKRMRRNAVLGAQYLDVQPEFTKFWQWRQDDTNLAY